MKSNGTTNPNLNSPSPTNNWWQRKYAWGIIPILILSFLAFFPSLSAEFTNWDDPYYVVKNNLITSLSWEHIKGIFTTSERSLYHPFTMLSLAINYQIGELNPFGYHLTNVLLHLINTFLVFLFIYHLNNKKVIAALIVAAFFGIHPMHVESVTWVSERKDVLYSLFFLLSLITYIKYVKTERKGAYWISLLLFFCSLMSKATAVTLPVVLLLTDYFLSRKWNIKVVLEKIPHFILAVIFGLLTIHFQTESSALGSMDELNIIQRSMFASYAALMYIVKMFVPINLSAFYPYPLIKELPPIFYIAPILIIGLLAITAFLWKKNKIFFYGISFYFITIALTLQFVSVGGAIISDRYTYIPYIGLFFILGKLFEELINNKDRKLYAQILGGLLLIASLVFSYLTFERTKVWKDSKTLWTDVINKNNRVPYAHFNRGLVYHYIEENYQKALTDYNNAIKIKPNYKDAYYNRGVLHFYKLKNIDKALADYNAAIKLKPDYVEAIYGRGLIQFYETEEYDKALADFNKTIKLNPNLTEAYNNRGSLLFNKKNEFQKAIKDFNKAISMDDKNGQYFMNRSFCYYKLNQPQKAWEDAQQAKKLGFSIQKDYLQRLKELVGK